MDTLQRWIFGNNVFLPSEEYDEFRYKFLIVLMVMGAFFSALFIAGEHIRVSHVGLAHFVTMHLYIVASTLSWIVLRGRKHLYTPVAWVYIIFSLLEFSSALWMIPDDELRVMWFFVSVPGMFVLLGQRAGWLVLGAILTIVGVSNARIDAPYSTNALITGAACLLYLGIFFHVFGARSVSYFVRMRDYNQQLQALANHDSLTGLLNARTYYARCEQLITLARHSGQPYAVLFLDLDHFKSINDQYGHAAGDIVLKTIAHTLTQTVRHTDVLGRIGGEEFSIFMPDTPLAGAVQLGEKLRRAVENHHPDIGTLRLRVTTSIGVAVCEKQAEDIHSIQQKADKAMYAAKSLGRNRVTVFEH